MKRISVRIDSTDRRVLAELEKQSEKVSDIIRRALSKYLHASHEPIHQAIFAENRRQYELRLKAYCDRQAEQKPIPQISPDKQPE